jgi:DNA-binding response OmpR family regulator
MTRRVLIAEPDADVRELLELTVRRLGYEVASELHDADAMLLEPACSVGRSLLRRFGGDAPPVVCLSIYPREDGLEPDSSVAYLTKPSTPAQIGAALRGVFAVQPAY